MANTGRGPRRMSVPPTLETVSECDHWTSAPVKLERAASNASLATMVTTTTTATATSTTIRRNHADGRVNGLQGMRGRVHGQPAAEALRLDTRLRRTSIIGDAGLCASSSYEGAPAARADGAPSKLWGTDSAAAAASKDPRATMLCDSPTQLDAVVSLPNMNKDLPPLPASTPTSRTASPAPSAPELSTAPAPRRAQPKRSQSASRAFPRATTDFGFFPLRRAATNLSFSSDKCDKDPCPTPKSILKKASCAAAGSDMPTASDDASLLSTEASSVSAPAPARKRVTLLEPSSDPPQKGLAKNLRRRSVDTVAWVAKTTTTVASKAVTAVAAIPIPIPRRRTDADDEYWSSGEEEDNEASQSSLDVVDWVAYGREFDPVAHELEFPPAPSEYVEDHYTHYGFEVRVTTPSPTPSTDSLVAKHLRTPAPWFPPTEDNRDDTERLSDQLRGFFDATTIAPPPFLLNGRYRAKPNRPVFKDVAAAAGSSGSPDTMASPVSSTLSFESEAVVTPSTSMLLHGFEGVDIKHSPIIEVAEVALEDLTPDLEDMLVVKPTRVGPRRPTRPPREYLYFG